jgi:hypothetical protein
MQRAAQHAQRLLVTVLLSLFIAACDSAQARLDGVKATIAAGLKVGDDRATIESLIESQRWGCSFDSLAKPRRYQCIIRDVGRGPHGSKSIQIYLNVDDSNRYAGAEVVGIY